MANFDVAIDLGTQYVSLLSMSSDVLVKQHNLVAVKNDPGQEILACGNNALKLHLMNTQNVLAKKPVEECIIKDKRLAESFFGWLFAMANQAAFENQKARVLCIIHASLNSNEKRQLEEMFLHLGAKVVTFVESPKCCMEVVFQQFDVKDGVMVNLGENVADFGCFVEGKMLSGVSLYLAGKHIDNGIKQFMEEQYNVFIAPEQAKEIKKKCSMYEKNIAQVLITGTNFATKETETLEVPLKALYDVIANYVDRYVEVVRSLIKSSSDEVAEKLKLGGVFLCGGLSQIEGVSEYMEQSLGIAVKVSAYKSNCSIFGGRLMLGRKNFF